jgi:Flp pilus assembly secretin CpaC
VVLTGTVQTPQDSAKAAKLAGLFVSGGEATTGQFTTTASAPTDGGGVAINNPDRGRRESAIVNMLTIVGEDQVTLKVTVAEVSRSVMKQLGVNMTGSGVSNGISYGGIFREYRMRHWQQPVRYRVRPRDEQLFRLSAGDGIGRRDEDPRRADADRNFR